MGKAGRSGDRDRGRIWETGRQRGLASGRQRGLDWRQMGCGGVGAHAFTCMHTDTRAHAHTWRLGWSSGSGDTRGGCPLTSSSLSWPPHLLGPGRCLGLEVRAGTFRDPAVSVMRLHQLRRQASPLGRQSPQTLGQDIPPLPVPRNPGAQASSSSPSTHSRNPDPLTSSARTLSAPPARISGPPGPR